jgi:hypothetical protein
MSFSTLVRVAHDEEAADRPALAALDRELGGHGDHALEHLGLHVLGSRSVVAGEQRLELALHVDHHQRVELVAAGHAAHAADAVVEGDEAAGERHQHRAAQLRQALAGKRAHLDRLGEPSRASSPARWGCG